MKNIIKIIFILLFQNISSQNGVWTWMKGDNIPNQLAIYGTQGVAAPANKPRAAYEGVEWRDLAGNFWLYDNFDLWKFNPTTIQWTWMKGTQAISSNGLYGTKGIAAPNNHPGERGFGSATWVDSNGNLWLFGGASVFASNLKNDLWKYNITTNQWTWMKGDSTWSNLPQFGVKGVSNPNNNPGSLSETNAAWYDGNNLWLFGGYDDFSNFWNTLWKYNISTNEWTWVSGNNFGNAPGIYGTKGVPNINNIPTSRACYTKWIKNDTLWLFGGMNFIGYYNDLWRYTISSNQWTWMSGGIDTANIAGIYLNKCVPSTNCYPSARLETRACWKDINNRFWLYGGFQNGTMNDVWVYNPSSNQWTWVSGGSLPNNPLPIYGTIQVPNPNNDPGGRMGSPSWIDSFNNLWVFGGIEASNLLNDLWKYQIDSTCFGDPTNIHEFNYLPNLSIYPIPFKDKITIEFDQKTPSTIQITLRNLQGEILKTVQEKYSSKKIKIILDIKELYLLDGIYILDILTNDRISTRKILKLDK